MKKGRLLLTSSTLWYIIPTFVWLPNRLVSGTAPKDGSLGGAGPQLLTLAATCTSSKKIRPRVASIATHACFFPTGMANSLKNLAGNSTGTPMPQHRKLKSKTAKRLIALHLSHRPLELTHMNQLPSALFS